MVTIPDGESPLGYLLYTLPPRGSDVLGDAVLDRFLDYTTHLGVSLYEAQERALVEICAGNNVILSTPTGSGKTLVATALHFYALARQARTVYTAPVKALVNEKFLALCREFGAKNVGLVTGDASVNADAPIVCATAEILANQALRHGADLDFEEIVIDEFHYYADRDRGTAWQIPLLTLPRARFLLMSATFGDPQPFVELLSRRTGRPTTVVSSKERPVPLDFEYRETPLHETLKVLVERDLAPIYVVCFTQRSVVEEAQNLLSVDYSSREQKRAIAGCLVGVRFDTAFGRELQRFLRHGIGVHHAGMLPKYRLLTEKLAQTGLLKVVVGTDTLGVGVNIPIRTVVLTRLCKYDGQRTVLLPARDFHQISGRAGRRGFDTRGHVVAQAPEHVIENARLMARAGGDPVKQKRIVRKKPPTRGYVHWDARTFERLTEAPPEPLRSSFAVSHQMLVNVLMRPEGGCRSLARLIYECHEPRRTRRALGRTASAMFRSLIDAGILELDSTGNVTFREDLQSSFSLHQALSLYLVEAVELLDPTSDTYALDVLSLTEAVAEDPHALLERQLDVLKTRKLAELKAAGVEYDERIAELDKLTYPKPNAGFIYDTFNDFARRHPWVTSDNIKPKGLAREMVEEFYSFNDFIREYGAARSEGLLLRYLSDVFRNLTRTVPARARTSELDEIITYLGAIVRSTDSSLLDEWERLVARAEQAPPPSPSETPALTLPDADREDVTRDLPAFRVLVHNALFSLLRALSRQDYDLASQLLDPSVTKSPGWLRDQLRGYFEVHGELLVDAKARSKVRLRLSTESARVLRFEQVLSDPSDDLDFFLAGTVDLDASARSGHPVIVLEGVQS